MVASAIVSDPFPPPAEWIAARRDSQVLLTVKDVEAMVKAGIVPEDSTTELLHGVLLYVDRAATGQSPVVGGGDHLTGTETWHPKGSEIVEGPDHNYVVAGLAEIAGQINSPLRHLRTQSTLICSDTHAPIPDAMLLRGPRTSYRGKRPTAADTFCVVEVADSSYERDTGEKLFGYARAGIPQYIVISLRNKTAEIHINPNANGTYDPPQVISAEHDLALRVGEDELFAVRLADLLP